MTCPDARFPSHGLCRLLEIIALLSARGILPLVQNGERISWLTRRQRRDASGAFPRETPRRQNQGWTFAERLRLSDRSAHQEGNSEEEEDRLSGASSVGDGRQRKHQGGSIEHFSVPCPSRPVSLAILSPIVDCHPGSKGLGLV